MLRRLAHALILSSLTLSGCAIVVADLNPFGRQGDLKEHVVQGEGRSKILLLDVSGVITAEEREESLGFRRRPSAVERVKEELEKAGEDDAVRAVVLRINSPGGTVTASDIIFRELRAFAAERKTPIVAQIMDIGASGAYYVALAADEIVAHPTSVTGSIGVVMFGINLEGLLDKIGVKDQTLKAGEHKDIGSPLRRMTAEEEKILQSVLDDMRRRFVDLVRTRRPRVSSEDLSWAADGRILTSEQARAAGLVDGIGYLDDAIAAARRRAGLAEARVILYRRPSEFSENIYSTALAGASQINLVHLDLAGLALSRPSFMYLWLPGEMR